MASAWPWSNMPNGPSKLSHMKRAESSSSSSSEASDRRIRQQQDDGRHTSRIQSTNSTHRTETTPTAGKGAQRPSSDIASVGEDGSSAGLAYEAGAEANSAAGWDKSVHGGRATDTGGDIQGRAQSDRQRILQGIQLSTSHKFSDSNGNVHVDAIQADDILGLGLEPVQLSTRPGSHTHPEHSQRRIITGPAASTRRRREDDDDQHGLRKAKRPRVEGADKGGLA